MTIGIKVASHETPCRESRDRPVTRTVLGLLAVTVALAAAPPGLAQSLPPTEIGSSRPESVDFEPFAAFPAGAELASSSASRPNLAPTPCA